MRVYLNMVLIDLKGQLEYRASFFLTAIGQFISSFTTFFGLYFIFQRVGAVDEFTFGQVLLCFSVIMMAFSLGELVGGGLAVFPRLLGNGELDRAMLRPRPLLLQVVLPHFDFTRLGILAQAILVLLYAIPASGVVWTPFKAFTLAVMVISGGVVFFCLFLIQATFSFFTTESLDFFNIFTYGSRQFGRYPFCVYGDGVLKFLTFVIPLALFQYYPLLYLLDRETGILYALAPLAALLFTIPSYAFYRFGISKFKSTGS